MKMKSETVAAQQREAVRDFDRKKRSDDEFFAQANEATRLQIIIAQIVQKNKEYQELQNKIEAELKHQHEKERNKFIADVQQYQAENEKFQFQIQQEVYTSVQQKLMQLKNMFTQMDAYLKEVASKLQEQIVVLSNAYANITSDFTEQTIEFIKSLQIQKFKRNQGAETYDFEAHLLTELQPLFNRLQRQEISINEFKTEIEKLTQNSATSFVDKMNIQDPAEKQSVLATVQAVANNVSGKLKTGFFEKNAVRIHKIQAAYEAIAEKKEQLEKVEEKKKDCEHASKTIDQALDTFAEQCDPAKPGLDSNKSEQVIEIMQNAGQIVGNFAVNIEKVNADLSKYANMLASFEVEENAEQQNAAAPTHTSMRHG